MKVWAKRQESILHQHQSRLTTASFFYNAKRANYLAYVCKHAVDQDPPVLDTPEYIAGVDMKNSLWLNEPKPLI